MPLLFFLAVTVIGKEHRIGWFDFSYLDILGGIGAIVFSMRFVVQWLASEKAKEASFRSPFGIGVSRAL